MKWNVKVWAPPKILSCQFFHQKIGTFDRKKKHQNKMKCQTNNLFLFFLEQHVFIKLMGWQNFTQKVNMTISNILSFVMMHAFFFLNILCDILFFTYMNTNCKKTYCLQKKSMKLQFFFILTIICFGNSVNIECPISE